MNGAELAGGALLGVAYSLAGLVVLAWLEDRTPALRRWITSLPGALLALVLWPLVAVVVALGQVVARGRRTRRGRWPAR